MIDVYIGENGVRIVDRSTALYLTINEAEALVPKLLAARAKLAKNKRVEAQRLLTEAEQLDPNPKEDINV